mgnify:CR=1 FL=1
MLIFKIFRGAEWAAFDNAGETAGAPVDLADGFIHFSTAAQLAETAARHFTGEDAVILAACDAESLGPALRWEAARNGSLFPHLYRPLRMADLIWHRPVGRGPSGLDFGDLGG